MLLRGIAAGLERTGDISHVFGPLNCWHWLRSLGRRPIVLTVVTGGPLLPKRLYDKVRIFVAESPALRTTLIDAGIPVSRIRLIYPGVDLSRFTRVPPPAPQPFRILFASWPEHASELEGRGVLALVELARRRPDVEVVLLTRRWGTIEQTQRAVAAMDPPPNVRIEELGSRTMSNVFAGVHATAALFAQNFGKSVPNSVIESLACGRPVLASQYCGIAGPAAEAGAGVSVSLSVEDVARGLDRLMSDWAEMSDQARQLAESTFSERAFIASYEEVYSQASGADT
jgi:glycosyltransferase involved in cell wall biosynthesis